MELTNQERGMLAGLLPRTQDVVLHAAEQHELTFLERLLAQVRRAGPDGAVVRNEFDAIVLEMLVSVKREVVNE